jgi:hypothetical protein
MFYIQKKHSNKCFSFTSISPSDIDAQSVRAETPLHQACSRGNEEAVRWLLANSADLHLANKMKETPLATLRGQESHIAEMLALADLDDATATTRAVLTWGFGGHGVLGYAVSGVSASERTQPTPRQVTDSFLFSLLLFVTLLLVLLLHSLISLLVYFILIIYII